jgi:hypothetical protein
MDILEITRTWQRDGRWSEVEPLRDELMREARRSGLDKEAARMEVYAKLLELFPQAIQGGISEESEAGGGANLTNRDDGASGATHARDEAAVTGLDAIPEDWPALPPNAKLSVEIQWVQANRLVIVRELGDRTMVDLSKAMTPAPSWSALGWLETSIRAYAKFVDVAAKASATLEDERETTRRERIAIDEIRGLLAEMVGE